MPTALGRRTSRDFALLNDLGTVTVLSFEAIHRRYFPDDHTGKSCQRRLRFLRELSLIAPVAITACFGPARERHTVYRLTTQGADAIAHQTGRPVHVLHTDPKPDTLLHRVLVGRTVLALRDAAGCAGLRSPQWLLEHDRWADAPRNVPEPKQYRLAFDFLAIPTAQNRPIERYAAPIYDDPVVRLVKARPDAAGLLALPASDRPLCLLLEVDTGTETHRQLLGKLPGYHALLTRCEFSRSWIDVTDTPPTDARVVFVFASEERLHNVLDRLADDPTALWAKTAGCLPTSEDRARAATFLERTIRFGTLADLEQSEAFSRPLWFTLRRRTPADRLPMFRPTVDREVDRESVGK